MFILHCEVKMPRQIWCECAKLPSVTVSGFDIHHCSVVIYDVPWCFANAGQKFIKSSVYALAIFFSFSPSQWNGTCLRLQPLFRWELLMMLCRSTCIKNQNLSHQGTGGAEEGRIHSAARGACGPRSAEHNTLKTLLQLRLYFQLLKCHSTSAPRRPIKATEETPGNQLHCLQGDAVVWKNVDIGKSKFKKCTYVLT